MKDKRMKRIAVVEIEISVITSDEKHFEKTLKDSVRDLCIDVWSGECKTGFSTSISTKKSKLVEIKRERRP
jgi:hypothetical protein